MLKQQKKIFVTGASGMLGAKITQILAEKDFLVLAGYNSNQEFVPIGPNIERVNLDITNKISPSGFKNIDTIIHCAAFTDVNLCELNKKQCKRTNVEGTKNLIKLAQSWEAKFIYISTPMVFSGRRGNYKELDRPDPINYYGKTKMEAEKIVMKYKLGLVIRVNPIGKRPLGHHPSFMQWFVDMASNNRSFHLFTDVIINPISTVRLSGIIRDLIDNFRPGILHIGSSDVVNKAEIWKEVLEYFPDYSGKVIRVGVNKTHAGKIASRPHEMWLNTDKARLEGHNLLPWKIEVKNVIKDIIEH